MGKRIKFIKSAALCMSLFTIFVPASHSQAAYADFHLSPASGTYKKGDTIDIQVLTNTGGQPVNSGTGKIQYSHNNLQFVSASKKGSIFTTWITEPTEDIDKYIVFEGGVPTPGFSGAEGLIMTLTFTMKADGIATVNFVGGKLLANDGKATNILTNMLKADFNGVSDGSGPNFPSVVPSPPPMGSATPYPTGVNPAMTSPSPSPRPSGVVLSETDFKVSEELKVPEIKEYSKNPSKKEPFKVKGVTEYKETVIIITTIRDNNETKRYYLVSDKEGNFEYEAPILWPGGKYLLYAEVVDANSVHSPKTGASEFTIIESKVDVIGQSINDYFPLVVLTILFAALIYKLIRKIVSKFTKKKEGDEVLDKAAAPVTTTTPSEVQK
jgi:hypothetical protein